MWKIPTKNPGFVKGMFSMNGMMGWIPELGDVKPQVVTKTEHVYVHEKGYAPGPTKKVGRCDGAKKKPEMCCRLMTCKWPIVYIHMYIYIHYIYVYIVVRISMVLFVDIRLSLFGFTRMRRLCATCLPVQGLDRVFSGSFVFKVVLWSCSVISLYVFYVCWSCEWTDD